MISSSVKKRFVKDYNLPITLFRDDIFHYFLGIYDEHLNTVNKWDTLIDVHSRLGESGFFAESQKIMDSVVASISSNESYAKFSGLVQSQNVVVETMPEKRNVYHPDFVNKLLISIDMKKANFNSMRFYAPEIFNASTYEEYLSQFTNYQYFTESKQIRQVIFGNLNPKAQQAAQRNIMLKTYQILSSYFGDSVEMVMTGPDEIVITDILALNMYVNDFIKILHVELDKIGIKDCHSIKPFVLDKVGTEKSFYVKVPYDLKRELLISQGDYAEPEVRYDVEFKQVPSFFYPQVFKRYFNLATCEYDFMFYHEGHYAKFLTSVFGEHDAN